MKSPFFKQNLFFIAGLLFGLVLWILLPQNPGKRSGNNTIISFPWAQSYIENGKALELVGSGEEKIYYTINGDKPGLNSFLYEKPIKADPGLNKAVISFIPTSPTWKPPLQPLARSLVLRAAAYSNKKWGPVSTRTFLFQRHMLPVVSIAAGREQLFDFSKGIYLQGKDYALRNYFRLREKWWEWPGNYQRRGKESEKSINIEFIDVSGREHFNGEAKVRINGNATRGFPQKSLRIKLSRAASKQDLGFSGHAKNNVKLKSYILRNSGNDWGRTMFNDALIQDLCSGLGFETHTSDPVVLYINGEYWGIHNLCERTDEAWIGKKYGVKKNQVIYLENTLGINKGLNQVPEIKHVYDLLGSNGVSDSAKLDAFKEVFEYHGFVNYLAAEIFFANRDWPANNLKFFSVPDSLGRRKWRFIMHDMDFAFSYMPVPVLYQVDMFNQIHHNGSELARLIKRLLKIPQFRSDLRGAFGILLEKQFSTRYIISQVKMYMECLEPEMQKHINRWRKPQGIGDWKRYCNTMMVFARKRGGYLRQHMDHWLPVSL